MNVLVTGASGFIGHNVLLRAPREWHDHRALPQHARAGRVRRPSTAWRTFAPVRCDLTNAAAVAALGGARSASSDAMPVSRRERRSGSIGRAPARGI